MRESILVPVMVPTLERTRCNDFVCIVGIDLYLGKGQRLASVDDCSFAANRISYSSAASDESGAIYSQRDAASRIRLPDDV